MGFFPGLSGQHPFAEIEKSNTRSRSQPLQGKAAFHTGIFQMFPNVPGICRSAGDGPAKPS